MGATTDPYELLDIAVAAAREGAELAFRSRVEGIGEIGTKTTATDLVTAADRAVERLLVRRLLADRPGDRVLGEETGETEQETDSEADPGADSRRAMGGRPHRRNSELRLRHPSLRGLDRS
jgi:3'-phosphoadenosine 5'-phosphosulfate (PAPS) 3'-phosphatase